MALIDVLVPIEQEGTTAIVRSWLCEIGQTVSVNDPLVELETDKVTQEVPAPVAGVVREICLDTDAEAAPGALLGRIEVAADGDVEVSKTAHAPAPAPTESTPAQPPTTDDMSCYLSPAVRRAVKQHAINPGTIVGTGRRGRVTRTDVDEAIAKRSNEAPLPTEDVAGPLNGVRSVPHDRMRMAIAQNMLSSVTTAPHVTAVFECDYSAIITHRAAFKASFEAQGAKLTYTAYLVAAAAKAMQAAPAINSRWFDDRLEIYDRVGVGIGTALGEKGLVIPVIPDAQSLSLLGIATKLSDLTERARSSKLSPADMRGGTFTISNHGVSGSLLATPIIINQPQSAILGVGKLEKRVVVREVGGIDTIQIRPMCFVSLTIDHRVVDGHQTNTWLTRFVEILETWPLGR